MPDDVVTIWLKHPFRGEPVEVPNTEEALVPWMVQGYQQVQPPGEAEKE